MSTLPCCEDEDELELDKPTDFSLSFLLMLALRPSEAKNPMERLLAEDDGVPVRERMDDGGEVRMDVCLTGEA